MISPEVATLAISVAAGAVKLGKRLDEIAAEERALRSNIALALPEVRLTPSDTKMRGALARLLAQTAGLDPDPLGGDRSRIKRLFDRSPPRGSGSRPAV